MTVGNDSFRAPLEWKFSQVFGERIAGEDIQDGEPSTSLFFFFFCVLYVEDSGRNRGKFSVNELLCIVSRSFSV